MRKIIVLMCVLMIATTAFGYGIDGTLDSSGFQNLYYTTRDGVSDYFNYSYEGGTPGAPLGARISGWDSTANHFSSYDNAADTNLYNSDGSTLTHTPATNWGYNSTGFYKPFNNGYYVPQGTKNAYGLWNSSTNDGDGFTIEWRIKLGAHHGLTGLSMQFDVTDARDGWMRLKGQTMTTVAGTVNLPTDPNQWNTYRLAVLGADPGDPCAIMGNFYQNNDLLFGGPVQVGTAHTVSPDSYLWAMVDFGDALYYYDTETDYIRFDVMGAWAPIPEPATMLLLLGGGLLSLRRRKK